ncbi:hypothetical protein ABEB36_009236 [Hypothenemus hampei]|uniref:Retrotransposon gag domain-containing protein n=1 Tax=Hypothenemus hampei TaxID=57062 RepID=A0ABD1EPK8_HYPHA
MEELTGVLTTVLREIQTSQQTVVSSVPIHIPVFNPLKNNFGAVGWCNEVEILATTFKWTDFEKLCRGASALEADAKEWYNDWQPAEKTWACFRNEICQLYPAKRNLSERFRRASLYSSDQATSYCEYARKKISLLKSLNLNLNDSQIIELVIGDITDINVKTAAFNSNIMLISALLDLLD